MLRGHEQEMGDKLIHKRGECLGKWTRGVQGGNTHVY
jgi:hypothetical protein